jgi:mRNA interferase MazF
VLVITRSDAVPALTWIVVAPVTRTVRRIPTEVALDARHGLSNDCAASFDNVQPIRRSFLTERVGDLGVEGRAHICSALRALADC